MNRILTLAIAAGGLLLLDAPEAAAHKELRSMHLPSAHYRVEQRSAKKMPRWLKRDKSFVRWYRHSRLKHDRYLTWRELFRIYKWEHYYARRHVHDRHWLGHYREYRPHAGARQPWPGRTRMHRH